MRRLTGTLLVAAVAWFRIEVLPFDDRHWPFALDAFTRYGKGRHPAGLNFGDCLAYAVARVAGEPLLCLGDDFADGSRARVSRRSGVATREPRVAASSSHSSRAPELEPRALGSGRSWAAATLHRCRGPVAPPAAFDEELAEALRRHRETPTPFELARTELCYGERLRRARRRRDASTYLRSALGTFVQLGAAPWAERARPCGSS